MLCQSPAVVSLQLSDRTKKKSSKYAALFNQLFYCSSEITRYTSECCNYLGLRKRTLQQLFASINPSRSLWWLVSSLGSFLFTCSPALPAVSTVAHLTYAHMDHVTTGYVRFNLISEIKYCFHPDLSLEASYLNWQSASLPSPLQLLHPTSGWSGTQQT